MQKGQKMPKEAIEKIRKKLLGRRCSMSSEFGKGHMPWNKGLKGKGICKANKGSFKKGQKPKNYFGGIKTCKDGIYIRKGKGIYSYQKDGKQIIVGKYESLARKKYREAFGKFDKKLCVWHKDGDVYNNDIDNLELITRAENIKRNDGKKKANCIICNKEFIKKRNKKTCSKECYYENYKRLAKAYQQKYRRENQEIVRENRRIYREKIKFKKEVLDNIDSYNPIPQSLNTLISTNTYG